MGESLKDTKNSSEGHCRSCPAFARSAFAHLSDSSLDQLAQAKVLGTYEEGAKFSEKGKPAEEVYCLRSGAAKVTLFGPLREKQSIVRIAAPGEMLGYRCVFSSEKFRGTASSIAESTACRISKDFIFDLIGREPSFSFVMLKRMGLEVAAAESHHQSFCQKNVRERLAEALLLLKEKFGEETNQGWKLNVRLKRRELANWIGSAKETVIRCLSDFKEDSMILEDQQFIYLTDTRRLAEIAGTGAAPKLQEHAHAFTREVFGELKPPFPGGPQSLRVL